MLAPYRRTLMLIGFAQCVSAQASADDVDVIAHLEARLGHLGEVIIDADEDPEVFDVAPPSLIAPELLSRMQRSWASDELDVVVTLKRNAVRTNIDGFSHIVRSEFRNGRLARNWIDAEPASVAQVESLIDEMTALLNKDSEAQLEANRAEWREIASRLDDAVLEQKLLRAPDGIGKRVSLTAKEIGELAARAGDRIARVGSSVVVQPQVATAMASLGLTAGGTAGYTGSGVAVWQTDEAPPDPTNPNIDENKFIQHNLLGTPPDSGGSGDHPTRMTGLLMTVATGTTVHWYAAQFCGAGLPTATIESFMPTTYLASLSVGGLPLVGYDPCEKDRDNFVLDSRIAMLHAAGNNGPGGGMFSDGTRRMAAGAEARNILAVGAVNDRSIPNTMAPFSSYVNTAPGLPPKPDIVAPGYDVVLPGKPPRSGTSDATAIASGLAAVVLEAYPSLKNQPQTLKMLLMASALDVTSDKSPPFDVMGDKDGAGMPNFQRVVDLNAHTVSLTGPNSVDMLPPEDFAFEQGKTYRIGLAWLNSGDWASNHGGQQSSGWALVLNPPVGATLSSQHFQWGFNLMEYTAPYTGTYEISAVRIENHDPSVPTAVGLAVVER